MTTGYAHPVGSMHFIIIAGSRTFNDYDLLARKMDHLTQNLDEVEVVSGAAKGADELGTMGARTWPPTKDLPRRLEPFWETRWFHP